jgi:hypothetical protein
VVLCSNVVPDIDHRFDDCDLLLRRVLHCGTCKSASVSIGRRMPKAPDGGYIFEKGGPGSRE